MSRASKSHRSSAVQGERGKVSEMILEFARPFLDAVGQPRSIEDLRKAFELVTTCWNLPVFEREVPAEVAEHRQHFDATVASFPEPLSSALLGLVASRKTTFGQVPFLVVVKVRGTSLDDCTIYAEARGSSNLHHEREGGDAHTNDIEDGKLPRWPARRRGRTGPL